MQYFKHSIAIKDQFLEATLTTLYMTVVTAIIAGIIGIVIGLLLVVTQEDGILKNKKLYSILDKLVNLARSIPFVIIIALLASVTRFLAGTTIGAQAAIVPLVAGTVPFFSRQIENSLVDVDKGVIEAARAMGNSPIEIIFRVYLKEGLAGIIRVSQLTLISLVGLTTMAGAIGAGGLGDLAISQGYNRFQNDVTVVATIIILIIVFVIQYSGNLLIKRIKH
ncbi:ABC transporter permease [Clostridium perfringens]|uniref:methionine ABC transporter permease n=1 Tax=Clostridium perfringens TaxID=1502 RepID=UPI0018E4C8A9|nr:methionine ABC transporter permease [Clostridium perfringens]ELC8332957.1 ABC transporter permease [Clostridium perfringens]ELC8423028.1 ABC transporter permease [Clostridium perfringens]ELC8451430.1 ABC transporter permease [Clostridium perfringens]MBI6030732.1 ABC transporter permease [Clostridium perfringens]MBI6034063.1 ABC transporter permease [Clostridium perfringens]